MAASVTATLIVRDEENLLGPCLQSLVDKVDEIVVADTGSSDSSIALATEHGARVAHVPWQDDFSAARNAALDLARGDWVLWIDADERLILNGTERLGDELTDAAVGARVTWHARRGFTPFPELRLFRNDPRIRFTGVIYESVMPAVERVCRSDGKVVTDVSAEIVHVGYEGDLSAKHARNLRLLERAVREQPRNAFYWSRLGEALAALARKDEAVAACRTAIDLASSSDGSGADAAIAYEVLLRIASGRGERVEPLAAEALRAAPQSLSLRFIHASALIEEQRYVEALVALDEFDRCRAREARQPVGYDERVVGAGPHELRGVALFQMGRLAEAAEAFAQAAALVPENLSYRARAAALRAAASSGPSAAIAS